MFKYVENCFSNFFTFKGRARRKEYWYFILFNYLIIGLIYLTAFFTGHCKITDINDYSTIKLNMPYNLFLTVFNIIMFFPTLSVSVRRLHDSGRSAWCILWCGLLSICCCIGSVLWLIFMLLPGNKTANKYGENPRAPLYMIL